MENASLGDKPVHEELRIGSAIGPYTIRKKLDWTGIATLYLVQHKVLGREVVLKTFGTRLTRESILKGSRLLAQLNHPNIAPILDVLEIDDQVYVIEEYASETSLLDMMKGEGIPVVLSLEIMSTVAGAIGYAHERGIVHRDVKPKNIVITPNGVPKIRNFEVAGRLDDPASAGRVGTYQFMAPELVRGEQPSPSMDIWGIGATTFCLLTGHSPYTREGTAGLSPEEVNEVCKAILRDEPVDITPVLEVAPEYVASILRKCLSKDVNERYVTALDLKNALDAARNRFVHNDTPTRKIHEPEVGDVLLVNVLYKEDERPGEYRSFRLDALIGEGQYGYVYHARDMLIDEDVAIKILKAIHSNDSEILARFQREAKIMASLRHPNVLRIHNYGTIGDSILIAMDLLDGGALKQLMALNAPYNPDRACQIMQDVLKGLNAIHAQGVVHRDLKPANIGRLKDRYVVCDFGTAFAMDLTRLTGTGTLIGTPAYMAPEQIEKGLSVPATDIYAAGVILYELLSGHLPHEADALPALLHGIVNMPPIQLQERRQDLPTPLYRLVGAMLEKEVALRPSASSVLETLGSI